MERSGITWASLCTIDVLTKYTRSPRHTRVAGQSPVQVSVSYTYSSSEAPLPIYSSAPDRALLPPSDKPQWKPIPLEWKSTSVVGRYPRSHLPTSHGKSLPHPYPKPIMAFNSHLNHPVLLPLLPTNAPHSEPVHPSGNDHLQVQPHWEGTSPPSPEIPSSTKPSRSAIRMLDDKGVRALG